MNSETHSDTGPEGNTKKDFRSRTWFLTINNFTDFELNTIRKETQKSIDYAWQIEMGEEKTIHVHACFKYENDRKFSTMKNKFPRGHLEYTKEWKTTKEYCMKEYTRVMEGDHKRTLGYLSGKLRLWQVYMKKYLSLPADDRSIVVLVDEIGGKGKTSFCKHMVSVRDDVLYLSGSAKYMKYAIMKSIDEGIIPKILLLDLTRSQRNHMSYQGIEEIKNGLFFNTHYESKMVSYDSPHVVVFTNYELMYEKLSMDRWKVIKM